MLSASNVNNFEVQLIRRVRRVLLVVERLYREPRHATLPHAPRGMNDSKYQAEIEKLTGLLKLVQQIALAASQAQSARTAFRQAIRIICGHQDWTAGHVYLRDESRWDALVSSGAWHCLERGGYEPLRRATVGSRIEAGRDVAWRVVESGEALWIEDLGAEPDWSRGQSAKGLVAGAMFPIRIGHRVVGVMEFYSTKPIERDEVFL